MKSFKRTFTILTLIAIINSACARNCPDGKPNMTKQEIIEGNNEFALNLYAKLRTENHNLFFSPYSISTAIALTYAGSKNNTRSQMAETMHFPKQLQEDCFHCAFGTIQKELNQAGQKGKYSLSVANALWGQKNITFLDNFLNQLKTNYQGGLNRVDFVNETEKARQTINKWVENQTNDKIKELIEKGILNKMTRLVLTNAIYFKGNWAEQFKKENTKDAPFTLVDGRKVICPMMNKKNKFSYMETDSFQALELPYTDEELSMIIFLPKKFDGLKDFEKNLTTENLSSWLGKLQKKEVITSIPKFKTTSKFELASILKAMGMKDAFSLNADFSGMTGQKDLFISNVIHQAYVDVNEKGTEAAAATAVVMKLTSAMPGSIPIFTADKPFVFLIRDTKSSSILFIGRIMNPSVKYKK